MEASLPDNEKALSILKMHGPQFLSAIANEMSITAEGARFHLLKLEKQGLVKSARHSKGRGRPQQIWSLTDKGNDRFPDTHADLTVKLISSMRDTLGENALKDVIDANATAGLNHYLQELDGINNLESRVAKLAEIRTREGYMADYQEDDEGYLLFENHCPICSAAKVCQGFCAAELKTFQSVLGESVSIRRVEHIIAGARRCAYRITPVKKNFL
ncbi:MAG: metalloregulator ArsR/SmtB family transcription factor [Balneolales bacterium]